MENPIKMDDLGVPLFSEISISACQVDLNDFSSAELQDSATILASEFCRVFARICK